MPKCQITQSGNDYAVSTPYDAKKSPLFNAMIKRHVLPEHRMPVKDGNKFYWIIYAGIIQSVAEQIEDIFGEKLVIPELQPIDESKPRSFQLDYVGIPKERDGQAGKTALGLSKGQWRVVFDEAILRQYFDSQTSQSQDDTLFSLLLVSETATETEIKSGYRRLARQWHPDVCKEENAEEMFKRISDAYQILSDLQKRARYQAGLAFERESEKPSRYNPPRYDVFIPPLRCGFLTVTGSVQVGRLRVAQILSWQDCVNEQGQTMVSSWSKEREAVVIEWV